MSVELTVTDYDTVVNELKRRGAWDGRRADMNHTIAFPGMLEVFYVQDKPQLAAWGKYSTTAEYQEVLANFTTKRWATATQVEISINARNLDGEQDE